MAFREMRKHPPSVRAEQIVDNLRNGRRESVAEYFKGRSNSLYIASVAAYVMEYLKADDYTSGVFLRLLSDRALD